MYRTRGCSDDGISCGALDPRFYARRQRWKDDGLDHQ